MLRVHFTSEDLARTTIAPAPDPMWEVLLSLYRLRRPEGAVAFGDWKRQVRSRLPASTGLLTDLAPRAGYSADFLTPAPRPGSLSAGSRASLQAGIEALRGTPRQHLHADVTELARRHRHRPPAWTASLARGDAEALHRLGRAVEQHFDACLAPYWQRVQAQVSRDHARRARLMAEAGSEGVLASLHRSARWSFPVLELAYPAEHDIHLEGRGLRLIPSFFCWGEPTTLLDARRAPVVVYPVERPLGWAADPAGRAAGAGTAALSALLGRTRAAVLLSIADGPCTTSELAMRRNLPLTTASQQAAVLREADTAQRHAAGRGPPGRQAASAVIAAEGGRLDGRAARSGSCRVALRGGAFILPGAPGGPRRARISWCFPVPGSSPCWLR
jgi:hypothetical protein